MPKFERIYWSKEFDWKNYSKLYDKYTKSKGNYYSQSLNKLLENIKLDKTTKIIDLGCGTGALTKEILKKNKNVYIFAIDISKEMVEIYKNNFKKEISNGQIKCIVGNAEKINKLTNEKYDFVFISSAFWDINGERLIKSLSSIINKKGKIIFNLPALVLGKERGFIFFIEHFFRERINSSMKYRRINLNDIKEISRKNNVKINKIKDYSFKMSKNNVKKFFNLLKYRYPFILFPKEMQTKDRIKKCDEIFKESLRYIPKDGIEEKGVVFILGK